MVSVPHPVWVTSTLNVSNNTGHALGVATTVTPNYVTIAQDPKKYLDVDVYLPPRSELDRDFVWVKPFDMPLKQILAWVTHLYKRQCDLDDGKEIVVFEFYKQTADDDKVEQPTRVRPAGSLEEYVDELEVNVEMHDRPSRPLQTQSGRSKDGSSKGRPYIPGERQNKGRRPVPDEEDREGGPMVTKDMIFENGSPGSIPGTAAERFKFLESLSSSPALKQIISGLKRHKVRITLSRL